MYSTIIPEGMATKTVAPTLPKSIQLRQDDLIDELNQFYIEVTGSGISEEYEAELREKDLDSLLQLIQQRKLGFVSMTQH